MFCSGKKKKKRGIVVLFELTNVSITTQIQFEDESKKEVILTILMPNRMVVVNGWVYIIYG